MLARVILWLALAIGAVLALAIVTLPMPTDTLAGPALDATPASGLVHPVTAVLLAFRAYDTLLEVAVVLLAVRVGAPQAGFTALDGTDTDPMTGSLLRLLVPLILLVSAVLLWAGTKQPGGAFAAGSLAAGAGVALRLGGRWTAPMVDWRWRALQAGGLAVFIVLGAAPLLLQRPWLSAPANWPAGFVVTIEVALTVSIAAGLVSLFSSPPPGGARGAGR
jgi:multisubunit Na+/H+ antiporter MnhB subunit